MELFGMKKASKNYDIVVAGAGIAGISAALSAARRGHSVALLEKQAFIGGLATSGLIFVYLPLCDGKGNQVTFGLAEELLLASQEYGPFDLSTKWHGKSLGNSRTRYSCPFSPGGFILTLDRLLQEAGVDLWLDTMLCHAVATVGNKVTAVEVENTSGRITLTADCFIDATGDAGLIRKAGGEFISGVNSRTPWFMEYTPAEKDHYWIGDHVHIQTLPEQQENPEISRYGLTGKENSVFIRTAWKMIRQYYDTLYETTNENRYLRFPLQLPAMPQYRTIAHIKGVCTIKEDDCNRRIEDSIGMIADWRCPGKIWETPYGALLPEKLHSVLAAGRCIASAGDAWEIYRVIPACALTGEVAGHAAALAVERGETPAELPLSLLRDELRKHQFVFHFEDLH